jgi:hypothetical protein
MKLEMDIFMIHNPYPNKIILECNPTTKIVHGVGSAHNNPGLDHIFIQQGPAPPMPPLLPGLPHASCPHMRGNSSSSGTTNVRIYCHLSHQTPWPCEGTPSINLEIMKVAST